jgi:hypothetical protein
MAIQGKFVVNNEIFSPLVMCGVGSFAAFSGDGVLRNRGGCTKVANKGPIPAGRYWIVDRPSGGLWSKVRAWASDTANTLLGKPSDHTEWFALYCDDGQIDDYMWIDGIRRGNFRLHPIGGGGISNGCITLQNHADFQNVRRALLHTSPVPAGNSGLMAYGWIEVVTYGNICPESR